MLNEMAEQVDKILKPYLKKNVNPKEPVAVVKPESNSDPLCMIIHKQILVNAYQNKVELDKSTFKSNINIVPTGIKVKLVGIFRKSIAEQIAKELYSDTVYRSLPESPFEVLMLPATGIIHPDYDH